MTRTHDGQVAKLADEQRDICRKSRLPGVLDKESRARLIHVSKEMRTIMKSHETGAKIHALETEIREIKANPARTVQDDDRALKLEGQIEALRAMLPEQEAAEQAELREINARAKPIMSSATNEEYRDFVSFVQTGEKREYGGMQAGDGASGGYAIPAPVVQQIMEEARVSNPVLDLVAKYDITGSNATTSVPILSHGATAWAAETATRTETTDPSFDSVDIECSDLYGWYTSTLQLLDSQPDLETRLVQEMYGNILAEFASAVVAGDGSTKPVTGIFEHTGYEEVLSGTATSISAESFLRAYAALSPLYRPKAHWLMSSATFQVALGLDAANSSATQPLVTFSADGTPLILGRPVVETQSAPDLAGGSFSVAFGDWSKAYGIATHRSFLLLRNDITDPGFVKLTGLVRVGGAPLVPDAAVLIETAADPQG